MSQSSTTHDVQNIQLTLVKVEPREGSSLSEPYYMLTLNATRQEFPAGSREKVKIKEEHLFYLDKSFEPEKAGVLFKSADKSASSFGNFDCIAAVSLSGLPHTC